MIARIGIAPARFEAVPEHRLRVDVKPVDRSPSDLCEIVGDSGLIVEFGDGADVAVGPNHHATTVAQAVTLGDQAIRTRAS
jgi:hypothetical protein